MLSDYLGPAIIWSIQHKDINWSFVPVVVPCAVATWNVKHRKTPIVVRTFLKIFSLWSPKEKTRSPMATAAWLTLLGPPSRCTVHHISTCNLSLNESQLTFCPAESIQSQFHLFLPKLISQGRLLLPPPPSPKVTPCLKTYSKAPARSPAWYFNSSLKQDHFNKWTFVGALTWVPSQLVAFLKINNMWKGQHYTWNV